MSTEKQARIAFVDLLFCWPPNGGADVDLYHVLEELARRNVEFVLYVPHFEGIMGRGCLDPAQLPFPVALLELKRGTQCQDLMHTIQQAVSDWNPDAVVLTHGYAMKAPLALALRQYPLAGRYYAHELLCARNPLRFHEGEPCPYNYLDHPDHCRLCALETLGPEIRNATPAAWTQEYLLAEAYNTGYHTTAVKALDVMKHIIVYNTQLRDNLGKYRDKTLVIPGGVSAADPAPSHLPPAPVPENKKVIFMSGRVEDPAKGLAVLLEAGARLLRRREDFHIIATHYDPMWRGPFFSSTGWLNHADARALMAKADICVVPSLWQEPFGLVALEAMVAGLPVCASDTGGLRDIILHNETGYLFPVGDAEALGRQLERLLDSESLRQQLGEAGRQRILKHYIWPVIVDKHYMPLIESMVS